MPGKRKEYLTWDEFFMGIAIMASARSKDPSNQVGACIVNDDNMVLTLGYNGLTRGMSDDDFHWDSIGEKTGEKDKIKDYGVVHAERNAVLNYRGNMNDLKNATLYVTWFPCIECTKEIIQIGIKKIVYLRMYSKSDSVELSMRLLNAAGVEVVAYNSEKDFTKEYIQKATNEIQKTLKRFSN